MICFTAFTFHKTTIYMEIKFFLLKAVLYKKKKKVNTPKKKLLIKM